MASSGTVPSQAFQPLSAKNFLSLKTTAKPVPRHQDASAAAATSPVDHSGHSRRVVGGGGGGNKHSNHSHNHHHNNRARGGRNAATMSHQPPSSSSDNDGHQSKSYLDTADLLADLPCQQHQQHHNHHLAVSDHSISSIVISPNRYHESSISNIIREHDLAVMEDHQLQQRRRSSQQQSSTRWQSSSDHNPKNQKVRFEHLHQSCPVIGDGIDKYHIQQEQQGQTVYYSKSSNTTGPTPSDQNGVEGMVRMTKSSSHSEPGESSPRSTLSKHLLNVENTRFDLAGVSRRGICLANLPFKSALQQTLLLRREQRQQSKDAAMDFAVESMHGDKLASIGSRAAVPGAPEETWERTIQDTDGNVYAVIVENVVDGGLHRFKICGTEPMFPNQRKSRDSGLFTYAEVKNSSGIGMKFTMKVRAHDTPTKYVTESFGPSIFQWSRRGQGRRTKGFIIKKIDESDGKKRSEGVEVARLTVLGAGKAMSINPDQDFRLIIAFSAIIDEMVEKRLR